MKTRVMPWAICATWGFLFVLASSLANAAGINLSWDDCGSAGSSNKTFACGTNSGSAILVASVVAPSGMDQLVGLSATLDLWTSPDSVGTAIPNWWQCGSGACRAATTSTSFDFMSGPSTCTDPWLGQASAGLNYVPAVPSANHARITVVGAVPDDAAAALDEGVEYYAFKVTVGYSKTVGTGNCAGCSAPASIALASMTLSQSGGTGEIHLTNPASGTIVTWQGGVAGSSYRPSYTLPGSGVIRSLYR